MSQFVVPTQKDAVHNPLAKFRQDTSMQWRRGRLGMVVEHSDGSVLYFDTNGEPWRECLIDSRLTWEAERPVEVQSGALEAMRRVCLWCINKPSVPDEVRVAARYAMGIDHGGEYLKARK